jgi:hypothetical protein
MPILSLGIPILALLIPVVAILTAHQRRMAELMHERSAEPGMARELQALRDEVRELRQRVDHHTIALDGVGSTPMPVVPPPIVERTQGY